MIVIYYDLVCPIGIYYCWLCCGSRCKWWFKYWSFINCKI